MTRAQIFQAYFAYERVAHYEDRVDHTDFFDFYNTGTKQKDTPFFSEHTFTTPSKITVLSCEDLDGITSIINPDAILITIDNDYDLETTRKIENLIQNSNNEFELAISDSPKAAWKLYGFESGIPHGITLHYLRFIENNPDILSEYLACHNDAMYRAWLKRHTVEVKLEYNITLLFEFGDDLAYIYEQRYCNIESKTTSSYDIANETIRITEIINGRKTRRFYGLAIPEEVGNAVYKGAINAWEITTYEPAE